MPCFGRRGDEVPAWARYAVYYGEDLVAWSDYDPRVVDTPNQSQIVYTHTPCCDQGKVHAGKHCYIEPLKLNPGESYLVAKLAGTLHRRQKSATGDESHFLVDEGARVKVGQTLCFFRRASVIYSCLASEDGELVSFLVKDGQTVHVGQPFLIFRRD